MQLARILVATDFSAAGQRAVRLGARPRDIGAGIVHATPPARWLTGPWVRARGARHHSREPAQLARIAQE
jgi:hypothetical protein